MQQANYIYTNEPTHATAARASVGVLVGLIVFPFKKENYVFSIVFHFLSFLLFFFFIKKSKWANVGSVGPVKQGFLFCFVLFCFGFFFFRRLMFKV